MTIIAFAAVAICVSTVLLAFMLWRRGEHDDSRLSSLRGAIRFISGPFPLSAALHVALLLFLVITIHESRGRDLTILTMEAGGGGGNGAEMRELELPEESMPEVAPVSNPVPDPLAESVSAIRIAREYVRSASSGIGTGLGNGVGSGHGPGFGGGFRGFVMKLRRDGLDVVLVIDGTGSMKLIIDDVRARMRELVGAIHNIVPTARVGIVVYGGAGEPVAMQPLTIMPARLESFLAGLDANGGGEWEENVLGGVRAATEKMDWRPYAKKVIVLVADSPPPKADFAQLRAIAGRFRRNNGALNAIDVGALEHQRFEAAFNRTIHHLPGSTPPLPSALPAFYRETQIAYQVLTRDGGGEVHALNSSEQINQQVMVLAFGEQWRAMVAPLSRSVARSGKM